MAHYLGTRVIDAPIEQVFDYRLDVRNLPEYNPKVTDVEVVDEGTPAEEKTFRFRLRMGPGLRTRVTLRVRDVQRPWRLEFNVQSLMNAREVCLFQSVGIGDANGTLISFDYTVDPRGGILAPLVDAIFVRPSLRRLVERELDLMKARLEGP